MSFKLYKNFLNAIFNETRFEIIKLLIKGPRSVNSISENLRFEQSRVSHNLKKLECYAFVNYKCKGKERIYSINKISHIREIIKSIDKYINRYNRIFKDCIKKN